MFYSFASPFADLGNAGVTRSPARPTEGASTFPLDLSSKTPPLARDLFDHQRAAIAASMLSGGFSEWCPSLMGGATSPIVPSDSNSLKGFDSSSKTPPLLPLQQNSAFLEQQKQLAALMFSCHALMDPVALFRARTLQHAFATGQAGTGAFVPPAFPGLATDMWSARGFETRSDESQGSSQPPATISSPQQPVAAAASVAAKPQVTKAEKTFQPWKDDVKPTKKTPFNIEELSKPDDSTTRASPVTTKDDAAVKVGEFKFSLHPKKRRLASPDSGVESGSALKPKKRLVQVLQKWEEPTVSSASGPVVSPTEVEESLLLRATRTGNLEMVTFCLDRCNEVDVNHRGRSHTTALHEAASRGFVAVSRSLLERGADPEAETVAGVRPIHEAAAKGHLEVVRLLLSYGADSKAKTYSGETPSTIAKMFDFKVVKQLIDEFDNDNSFAEEEDIENGKPLPPERVPWQFSGNAQCLDKKLETGSDVLQGAPEFSLIPEIAIRTFRVLRPTENGNMQSLTCAHLDELIASTGLTDVGVFLRTIGDEISMQIVFNVNPSMETDAFSKYYSHLKSVRAIRWDEESKRLLSQALSRGQEPQPGTSAP